MRKEDRVRERRSVTIVEEIEGKEMQKETGVERLAGRRVEGRNNSEWKWKWGFWASPYRLEKLKFQYLETYIQLSGASEG